MNLTKVGINGAYLPALVALLITIKDKSDVPEKFADGLVDFLRE